MDEIHLQMGALHHKKIRFYIIYSPNNPNPDIPGLPDEYSDLSEAFSKAKASQLPPHRSSDCSIELLPGIAPPSSRIFPLSQPESEAMKAYIDEELHKGFIRPSTLPASDRFFFVKKKDVGLRPCIDYRGLYDITVKFRYPLPLVPAALEQLRQAKYFTKLDLRSKLHSLHPLAIMSTWLCHSAFPRKHIQHVRSVLRRLIQYQLYANAEKCEFHQTSISFLGYIIGQEGMAMDESKVSAVLEWPQPRTVKELKRFLAIQAFQNLKERFTSAPILHHPDPSIPFIVEADASSTGIGAVLSQRQGDPAKMSSAEGNYNVGNRELLAIRAALEEWRHWLEGSQHPFAVLTDHKNLYLNICALPNG
ncbi:Transposon Tf2-11 polyprotein [Labeo rohita]|uniref:Transposon Tf2-11 polyprotein n=1 Tax=Labeo rohita TaxID=84645 RepID=A0ABQ8LKF1_LABRO|nr:Transposon Tf2-11 polyprotein [Labeo rohita]